MPWPPEYQRASVDFEKFMVVARDAASLATTNAPAAAVAPGEAGLVLPQGGTDSTLMLLIGLVIFGLGSFAAGFSHSGGQLAAWRAVMGVGGAFVAAHSDWIEWMVQRARPYIYTTAAPPALDEPMAIEDRMDRTDRRARQGPAAPAEFLANLGGAPVGVVLLQPNDLGFHDQRELVRMPVRTPAAVGQTVGAVVLVPVINLVAGLARDPELGAQGGH